MSADSTTLQLDATPFIDALRRAEEALRSLYRTEDSIIKLNREFSGQSTQLTQTLSVVGDAADKASIKIVTIDGALKAVSTSVAGSSEKLAVIQQVLDSLNAELARGAAASGNFAQAQKLAAQVATTEMKAALDAEVRSAQQAATAIQNAALEKEKAAQQAVLSKTGAIQTQILQGGITPAISGASESIKKAYADNTKTIADFAVAHKITWDRIAKEEARIISDGPKNYNAAKQQIALQLQSLLQERIAITQKAEAEMQDITLKKMQQRINIQTAQQQEAARIYQQMRADEANRDKLIENERITRAKALGKELIAYSDKQIDARIAKETEAIEKEKVANQTRVANAKMLGKELISYSDQQIANAKARDSELRKQQNALANALKLEERADEVQNARMRAAQTYSQVMSNINNGVFRNMKTVTEYDSRLQQNVTTMRGFNNVGKQVSVVLNEQNGILENARLRIGDLDDNTKRFGLTWESIIRLMAIQVIHQAISRMVMGIQQSIQAAQDLQIKIAQIQTISEASFDISTWSKGIMEVSNATGLVARDVAEGVYDTLSNQIADGAKAMEFMSVAGQFAITTNASLKESVNALSSVINSYGMSVNDATHIGDVFFRMIDLGRITAGQFANDIGRILPAADQLGVKLEEVAAVLSTLTRAGVTPAQAMTSLFNVFSRLLKPAGEMKEFLRQLGVASGQAAIQTYGFAEVLGKIATFAQGRPEVIAQLFPDIRGLRAMLRLAGEGLKEFNSDLDAMYNSAGAMSKAFEYFNNNPGKQFQIEMNKINNLFTADWGTVIVERIAAVNKNFFSLSSAVRTVSELLLYIGGPAVIAGIGKLVLGTKALEAGIIALIAANKRLAATGGIGTIVGAGMVIASELLDDYTAKLEKAEKDYEDAYKNMRESNRLFADEVSKNMRKSFNDQSQSVLQNLARIRGAIDTHNEGLKEIYNDTLTGFKDIHDAFVDLIKKDLDEVRQFRDEAKKEAESADKYLKEQPVKLQERQIQERLSEAETPAEKTKLLVEEFNRLFNLMRSATTMEVLTYQTERLMELLGEMHRVEKESEKTNDKIAKQRQKNAKDLAALDKQLADNEKKQAIQKIANEKAISDIKRKGKFVQVGDELKPINKAQQLTLEKQNQATEKLKQKHDEILRKKQEILQKDEETRIINYNGLNTELWRNKVMSVGVAKAELLRAASEAAQKANQLNIENLESQLKNIQKAFADIEKFKFADIFKIDINVSTEQAIDSTQKQIAKMVETGLGYIDKYEEALKKINRGDTEESKKAAEAVKKIKEQYTEAFKATEKRINLEISDHRYKVLKETQDKLLADYLTSLADLKSKQTVPLLNLMEQPLLSTASSLYPEGFKKAQDELKRRLQEIFTQPEKIKNIDDAMLGITRYINILVGMGKPGGSWEKSMRQSGDMIENQVKVVAGQYKALEAKRSELANIDKQLTEQYKQIQQAFGKDGFIIEATKDNTDKTVDNTVALAQLKSSLEAMSLIELWKIANNKTSVEGFAQGGYAKGTDTIPAMLSPGEFVVNSKATRRFYSQLVSMNSGVRHFDRGGLVTNVGDINVNLTPTGNTKVDVVSIGNELRREIRRGRLRLV